MKTKILHGEVASSLKNYLNEMNFSQLCILCDSNTKEFCLPLIESTIKEFPHCIIETEVGDENKTLGNAEKIFSKLVDNKVDKDALLCNLGGGVVSDIGGFIASTYKRGFPFVNIPSSLLAQVDASIGGKTAVNLGAVKNAVGTFSFPEVVFLDTEFLQTLPDIEWRNGMAEMIKHAILMGGKEVEWILETSMDSISDLSTQAILRSAKFKSQITEIDPYETAIRKQLNLGHTFGHALEGFCIANGNPISHGHAVAIGLIVELFISSKLIGFDGILRLEIEKKVLDLFPKVDIQNHDFHPLKELMIQDKKNKHGKIHLVLMKEPANYELHPVDSGLFDDAIKYYLSL